MQAKSPGFAIIADVKQGGLDDFLNKQFPASNATPGITVLDQNSLSAANASSQRNRGGYAVVREHEAIFSNSIASLALINAQLNAGASGFAASGFGQQISAAYGRGAGIILAADLHQMIGNHAAQMHVSNARQPSNGKERHGERELPDRGTSRSEWAPRESS
jgi:hypothetical protein